MGVAGGYQRDLLSQLIMRLLGSRMAEKHCLQGLRVALVLPLAVSQGISEESAETKPPVKNIK